MSTLLAPPFFPPVFPSRAVKSFAFAPFLSRRRWRLRPDLNRKPRCWLYLKLRMGWLYVHRTGEQKRGKRT
jgi:hypothetical protein